jgi:hypothetical protein
MAKKIRLTDEDNELLAELGIEIQANNALDYNPMQERIISGFEEIQKFVEEQGRLPEYGENKDVSERLYAVRLDRLRKQADCISLLKSLDHQNLLDGNHLLAADIPDDMDDDELLAHLGVHEKDENSITKLKHVIPRDEKRAAEEIANRTRCEDFEQFKPLFDAVKKDIDTGYRNTVRFRKDAGFTKATLKKEHFLIVGGQISFIAEIGQTFKAPNGTESNILLRSLIRAMYKDETSRFITDPNSGPLFSGENSEDDLDSGTIYVLRSHSDHPVIRENRDVVHKIGVTGGDVKKRLAIARYDPTFLMADVEIVATYKLANINRNKLEKIIHRFFDITKLEIEIKDRFGRAVRAQEWFLVPVFIIDELVEKIKDGSISDYYYDPSSVELKKHRTKI